MADMLGKHAHSYFGCCAHCARGTNHNTKPQRKARRQARAIETRQVRREVSEVQ